MDSLGLFQNDIDDLEQLGPGRYENIFRVYSKGEKYIYNLLRRVDIDLSTADPATFLELPLKTEAPWTNISYQLYGTIDLWWLVYICNKDIIRDPLQLIPGGTKLRVIKTEKLQTILNEISSDLKPRV
jgi:hypothetical protein